MQSIEYRYNHDPAVKALVDSLSESIERLNFTPSEIRECAVLAAINVERRRITPVLPSSLGCKVADGGYYYNHDRLGPVRAALSLKIQSTQDVAEGGQG